MPDESPGGVSRPSSSLPATLDRAALERVLARAAELQASQAEPSEGMTEGQLIELGHDVGIPPEQIRQALAEERTRVAVPPERGLIGGMFGPTVITASRIVAGTPVQVLDRIDRWMQDQEALTVRRRFTDRLTWEPRRDLLGSLKTSFSFGGKGYALTSANEVGATVAAIDAERTIVRLDADFSEGRRRRITWSAVVGGGALASGAGLVALTFGLGGSPLVGEVVAGIWTLGGGVAAAGIAAAQRRKLARAQLALEQVLDGLERAETRRGNPIAELINAVTRTVDGRR
jgi:hypothetical protein